MKISVVIASYNGVPFISEQLASIAAQSVVPHEIIVSDDHSTDATKETVEAFAAQNPQISVKFSVNPSSSGVDNNFAHAISLATGEVIFICDQDDVWLADRLETMMTVFEESPHPVATFCDSRIVDENLNDLGYTHLQSRGFPSVGQIFADDCRGFLKRVPPAGHDMAFHAAFKDVLLPFPDLENCYDTWIGLVLFALGAWKQSAPIPLTLFRRHSRTVTRSGLVPSVKEKFMQAKKAIDDDVCAWYAKMYQELIDRVGDRISPEMRLSLEARRDHSSKRSQMNVKFFKRLKMVYEETKNGNYFRYGRSYLNIFQDIFLRRAR